MELENIIKPILPQCWRKCETNYECNCYKNYLLFSFEIFVDETPLLIPYKYTKKFESIFKDRRNIDLMEITDFINMILSNDNQE